MKMTYLNNTAILKELCKSTGKWGLFIRVHVPDDCKDIIGEVTKAVPFLTIDDHYDLIFGDSGYFLFDSEEEMEETYWKCVGDDGPTHLNKYNGPARAYALTCCPKRGFLNENT